MNQVIIIGRMTKDPVVRWKDDLAMAQFTIAVDRPTKAKETDFISCKAWGKTAELIEKYMKKGSLVAVDGAIQTGSYEKDGVKNYTTDVKVNRVEFLESKKEKASDLPEGFEEIDDDEIPFG